MTAYILALDMADCIISLFPTHMEQLSSCASVGNSSYVARVAFWDYIFRGCLLYTSDAADDWLVV